MKYRVPILVTIVVLIAVVLTSCSGRQSGNTAQKNTEGNGKMAQADIMAGTVGSELNTDYEKSDKLLADISRQLSQPNILKDDILRGWYLGGKNDRKFGTPDTWIFFEDGENSKWISPNSIEEEDLIDGRELCRKTAGTYFASCLQTSDPDCEYVEQSYCQCLAGSAWNEKQGCILTTERGSFLSINSAELEQGWYLGLPNEKKLNTPSDWVWVEKGKESVWTKN
jgi:hypothetical protein